MEKARFIEYCKRYLCDKDTVEQYVRDVDKEQYNSSDSDAVYKIYVKKIEGRQQVRHVGRGIGGVIKGTADGCYSSKQYIDDLSDRRH